MNDNQHKAIYLKDYKAPDFLIESVFLHFELGEEVTTVKSILTVKRNPIHSESQKSLVLDGEELTLKKIVLNNEQLAATEYLVDNKSLTVHAVPEYFTLEIEVEIQPQLNTRLSGLYKSGGNFCTQCESQGFRRITYFPDRPDVLTYFTTTISADKSRYPLLLSNGNLVDQKELANNRHWVKWEDPSLKPCYLFALVAGDLDGIEETFITYSGRHVALKVYVERGKRDQTEFAMRSLKNAMRWDEKTFGREYELDIYMIVAVSDFNFGAMENKGLNIFNDKYILAKPESATDDDFINVEGVIGHEYFHNWSGNRVTVRDWFQITLKEGLTVFCDENFAADMNSKAAKRIQDVRVIRNVQFPQDAGPMAHPILPDSYIEINNFYTVTVYQKGAEVIRMIQTLLGQELFRKAMDLYFSRNDGHAVTTEDFVRAMEDASGVDLKQFRYWYKQAGTPLLTIHDDYDPNNQLSTLTIIQSCPPTPGQTNKKPFHIPMAMGLLDDNGNDLPLQLVGESKQGDTTRVLNIKKQTETFQFINLKHKPIPSLLRNFSAPVKLDYSYTKQDLIFLMSHDSDEFNRWDASQKLALIELFKLISDYQAKRPLAVADEFIQAFNSILTNENLDYALIAEMLILPSVGYLIDLMNVADVDAIYHAREFMKKAIAEKLHHQLLKFYQRHASDTYELSSTSMAQRRLKNLCLMYLAQLNDKTIHALCLQQFSQANNMTDAMGALTALIDIDCFERSEAILTFYEKWKHESLVLDKWFALQAQSALPNTLGLVKSLLQHPAFDIKNPNKARALIGAFASGNHIRFHAKSGEGYEFLVDQVLRIHEFNPQLAARLLEPMTRWRKYDDVRQRLMRAQLERIAATPALANDVYEVVSKSLHA